MGKDTSNPGASKRHRRPRSVLSWSAAPPETLRSFIGAMTDNGCAVLFGRTMDGSALMVQGLAGERREKDYIATHGDIVPALCQMLEDLIDEETANALEG